MSEQAAGASATTPEQRCFERAEVLAAVGRSEEAIEELRRGLAESPRDPELLGYLGWLSFFAGRPDDAEQAAQGVLAIRPHDARALNTLVEATVAAGRYDEGLEYARQLCEHYPDWQTSHLHLAHALASDPRGGGKAKRARAERVRSAIGEALLIAPEDVETLRRSAALHDAIGDRLEAERLVERGLEIEPGNESLLLHAANLKGHDTVPSANPLIRLFRSSANETEALRLLSGVLAENPQQRAVVRSISDSVWLRTQMLAGVALGLLVMLMLICYLAFGDAAQATSPRSRVRFGEALLMIPAIWFLTFLGLRDKGLPKRFLRRLYAKAWWVWGGIALAVVGGLGTVLIGFALLIRTGQIETMGSYVGGITRSLGFLAWVLLIAELLIVLARFRAESATGLFPRNEDGGAAAREGLLLAAWGLLRAVAGGLLALVPILAAPIAMRPEAAGGFAAVAAAVAVPPLVRFVLALSRVCSIGWGRALVAAGLLLAAASIAGTWMLADRHASEFDPPPTPMELEMRELSARFRETSEKLQRSSEQLRAASEGAQEALERAAEENERQTGEGR